MGNLKCYYDRNLCERYGCNVPSKECNEKCKKFVKTCVCNNCRIDTPDNGDTHCMYCGMEYIYEEKED